MAIETRWLRRVAVLSLALNAALIVLGAARQLRSRPRPPVLETRERARAGMFHELAAAPGRRDVVVLGDSLTERGEWWELLERPVANRGIANDTVATVRARLDDVVALSPRVVFVLNGVNDLFDGMAPEHLASEHAALVGEL